MYSDLIMQDPSDHVMANTWRLIFESKSQVAVTLSDIGYSELEELLCEYRLIGFTLAQPNPQRRYN